MKANLRFIKWWIVTNLIWFVAITSIVVNIILIKNLHKVEKDIVQIKHSTESFSKTVEAYQTMHEPTDKNFSYSY